MGWNPAALPDDPSFDDMCGITGFWSSDAPALEPERVLSEMIEPIRHRGPDDEGRWSDAGRGLYLGHRRLAVVDLSSEGHQPMLSQSGRYVITYNGEIYNYEDLRSQLGPRRWRGHSDTEVMLAAFEEWGVEEGTKRLNGQFAFAVWDAAESVLTLVRDRLGIKPLYFGQRNGTVFFGSELKSLWSHPRFVWELEPEAVASFLELGYVPGALSIFKGVHKLRPGCLVSLRAPDDEAMARPFWSLTEVAGRERADASAGDTVLDRFENLLRDAVRRRMVADVPVGAFLSGGIDSSLIVSLMQQEAAGRVRTFSIGFHDEDFDEAPYATRIAEHLGTDHTNLYVTPRETFDLLEELPSIFDEPFADESQLPTALVSRLARKSVTVCLSGDGGDELFGGYTRYDRVAGHWSRLDRLPAFVRRLARGAVAPTAACERTEIGRRAVAAVARLINPSVHAGQVTRQMELFGAPNEIAYYARSVGLDSRSVAGVRLRNAATSARREDADLRGVYSLSVREMMMLADAKKYLPDDILVKVDRASMDVALEVRVPFLDHRVVELSWEIPEHLKLRDGQTKWIVREVLNRHVPRELFERPKQGFAVPLAEWLRGPLRDWGEALLEETTLEEEGLLDPSTVRSLWRDHINGRSDAKSMLWRILTLQAWLQGTKRDFRSEQPAGVMA